MTDTGHGSLQIEVLGPVRAWLGGQPVGLGSGRQRAVLAMLALGANRVVSREELIDGVWGDHPPERANGSLYTYVSGLRRSIEPTRTKWATAGTLTSAGSGYQLTLGPDALDVHRFERLRQEAVEAQESGEAAAALRLFDEASALRRGEPLSGIPGPFAASQRSRFEEIFASVQERRIKAVLDCGEHDRAVAELTTLIERYPLREALRAYLMTALYRCGRHAEALDAYQAARHVLIDERGMEPGPMLQKVHAQILANEPEPVTPAHNVLPTPRRTTGGGVPAGLFARLPDRTPKVFVGRGDLVDRLHALVTATAQGTGAVLWCEGEPGIGKSTLLASGLADASQEGCQVCWASADELGQHFPLRAILDCLDIREQSADPRRAELAVDLQQQSQSTGLWGSGDPVVGAADRILSFVVELCRSGPLVLVLDEFQWADEASILVWNRLVRAAARFPLLLVGAARPIPRRAELDQLRRSIESAGAELITLRPLSDVHVEQLLSGLLEATPSPALRQLAARAGGNPMYIREMIGTLQREASIVRDGRTADVSVSPTSIPTSLTAAVARRLGFLSPEASDALRWAALLGQEFSLSDISAALGRSPSELLAVVDEAMAAGIVIDAGPQLTFRHALIRQALYDSVPRAMRGALHRQAAEALYRSGAPAERIAEQLLATPSAAADPWVVDWLLSGGAVLATRTPPIAAELMRRSLDQPSLGPAERETLTVRLARLLFRLGRRPDAQATWVLAHTTNPYRSAGMRWILAYLGAQDGRVDEAITDMRAASTDPGVPDVWKARCLASQAAVMRSGFDDLEAAEACASRALDLAESVPDKAATALALQQLWLTSSVRRDHPRALRLVDRALDSVAGAASLIELQVGLVDNKIFTLQNLDLLEDASNLLISSRELFARHGLAAGLRIATAVHEYWLGNWDTALAELDRVVDDGPEITFYGQREHGPALLRRGVAAMIAARRDDLGQAITHLDFADRYSLASAALRENCDFLLVARAQVAWHAGDLEEALAFLEPVLDPDYAKMMLRHQWLPGLTRIALEARDRGRAEQALAICEDEAAKEVQPARATAAANHCRSLVTGDPESVLHAVSHYRVSGRQVELAQALDDAAILCARAGRSLEAARLLDEAMSLFDRIGATWDLRRARKRGAEYGISMSNAGRFEDERPDRPSMVG